MGRRLGLVALIVVVATIAVACGQGGSSAAAPSSSSAPSSSASSAPSASPKAPAAPAAPAHPASTAGPSPARLSTDQLAGQRVIYAYAGLRPPPSLLRAVRAGEAGGVIFFAPNISSPVQLRGVIAQLQRASLSSPVHAPLLMLTDQEGGEVRRLPGAPTLSEKQIGERADAVATARASGAAAAANLRSAGINVNLSPVLDVYRRAGNFIDQFGRSYSSSASRVAGLGAAFISTQQRARVAATAKHFPGLGAAARAQDTDAGPVTLNLALSTLRAVDEAPYRQAIAAGVKLVMTSWAIYPALDRHRPAGLSPAIIGGELRRRLHFKGVTITDGIDAGAVAPYGSLDGRSVAAAAAGADLILCAANHPQDNTPAIGVTAMRAIAAALARHTLGVGAARTSAARILALRSHA